MSRNSKIFFLLLGCMSCTLLPMEKKSTQPQSKEHPEDIVTWVTNKSRLIAQALTTHRCPTKSTDGLLTIIIASVLEMSPQQTFFSDLNHDNFLQAILLLNNKIAELYGISVTDEDVRCAIMHSSQAYDHGVIGFKDPLPALQKHIYQEPVELLFSWRQLSQYAFGTNMWGPYCFSNEWERDRIMLADLFNCLVENPKDERPLLRAILARLPKLSWAMEHYEINQALEETLVEKHHMQSLAEITGYCNQRSQELDKTEVSVGEDMESLS